MLARLRPFNKWHIIALMAVVVVAGVSIKLISQAATVNPYYLSCPTPHATISQGSTGGCVKYLQWSLNRLSYGLTVDGIFGAKTNSAVRSFQSKYALVVDGIVGPKTWGTLDRVVPPGAGIKELTYNSRVSLKVCATSNARGTSPNRYYPSVRFMAKNVSGSTLNSIRIFKASNYSQTAWFGTMSAGQSKTVSASTVYQSASYVLTSTDYLGHVVNYTFTPGSLPVCP
jgi:hypothetical protein